MHVSSVALRWHCRRHPRHRRMPQHPPNKSSALPRVTLHFALPIHCRHCDDPVSLIKHLQYMSDVTQRTFSCCSAAACITAVHRVTHRCSCRTSVSTDTQKQARLCAANLSHMHKHRPSPKHTALCRVRSWFSVPHPLQVGKRYARQL